MIRIPATKSKYGSKKTAIDGITFDSQKEALRYIELKRLKQAGIVKAIDVQPLFSLQPRFWKCCGAVWGSLELKTGKCPICQKKIPATKAITYIADFRVTYADGHQEIEDIKGMETALFKLKRKMFEYRYPELTLKVVKGARR